MSPRLPDLHSTSSVTVKQLSSRTTPLLRFSALSAILAALNVYVCRELFRIEYLRHVGSIEAAFISIARYARDHWTDLTVVSPLVQRHPVSKFVSAAAALDGGGSVGVSRAHRPRSPITRPPRRCTAWRPSHCSGSAIACRDRRRSAFSLACSTPLLHRRHSWWRTSGAISEAFFGPRRLEDLVVYGEGPHVTGLALLPLSILLLDIAIERRRPHWYVLTALAFAATVLSNWLAAMALAIAVFAYLLARWPVALARLGDRRRHRDSGLRFCCPLGATLHDSGDSNECTHRRGRLLAVRSRPRRFACWCWRLRLVALKFGLQWMRASRTVQFGAYTSLITASCGAQL